MVEHTKPYTAFGLTNQNVKALCKHPLTNDSLQE